MREGNKSIGDCDLKSNLSRLYQLIPCDNIDKPHYLTSGLKWSSSGSPVGHPRLHQHIAYGLWQMKKYPESRQHFLQSSDGQGCGHMLVEFHQRRGFNSELDLFIAQTVLQYLCLKKLIEAANVFRTYTKNHPNIKCDPPFSHPLLNFLWLLLVSIKVSSLFNHFSVISFNLHRRVKMFKLTPCFVRNTSNLLTKIRSISNIWIKLARTTLVFLHQEKRDQVECSQVLIFYFGKNENNIFVYKGLFDSLLNAMNEDSSDDENGPPPGPSSASAARNTLTGATASASGGNKKLEQEDLD